jgi:hypothetical protein
MVEFGLSDMVVILLLLIVIGIFYLSSIVKKFGIGVGHCFIELDNRLGRIEELLKGGE